MVYEVGQASTGHELEWFGRASGPLVDHVDLDAGNQEAGLHDAVLDLDDVEARFRVEDVAV